MIGDGQIVADLRSLEVRFCICAAERPMEAKCQKLPWGGGTNNSCAVGGQTLNPALRKPSMKSSISSVVWYGTFSLTHATVSGGRWVR